MQVFTEFAEQYGTYTFRKRGGVARTGNRYTSTVFFLNQAGQIELRVTNGTVWKHDGVTETVVLTPEDFTDENLLNELAVELHNEFRRRSAISSLEASARSKVSLGDAISQERLGEGMGDLIV